MSPEPYLTRKDRFLGNLLGLAACDALGTTIEFQAPGTFTPLTDLVGGGPFSLKPGEWTDDTSLALCLADSLVETGRFDPKDQAGRYVRWWKEGYLSSNGRCFDIGNTTRAGLVRFMETGEPCSGPTSPRAAGNGSLMRLAPVPLFFLDRPGAAIEHSGLSSRTTHGAPTCIDACRYYGGLINAAASGVHKEALLSPLFAPVEGYWTRNPLVPEVTAVARGSFRTKEPPAIKGTGYVVASMEAALWAFHRSSTFKEGALLAVNLGDDTDTTGAVYGQLAGAFYGLDPERGVPETWIEKLAHRDVIEKLALGLLQRSAEKDR